MSYPIFPAVSIKTALIQDHPSTPPFRVFDCVTKVRLPYEGDYYFSVCRERYQGNEFSDSEDLSRTLTMIMSRFITNCYTHILLGKVNPEAHYTGFINNELVYVKDKDNNLSDKDTIELRLKVQKAQMEAWMENMENGKGDANGEYVPSNKQIADKL